MAADPGVDAISHHAARLKRDDAFRAVYRRGRWARGTLLSVGILPNPLGKTRVGLRTARGFKGAVARNRIKRQLRALVKAPALALQPGRDIVIVARPVGLPVLSASLRIELLTLCRQLGAIS